MARTNMMPPTDAMEITRKTRRAEVLEHGMTCCWPPLHVVHVLQILAFRKVPATQALQTQLVLDVHAVVSSCPAVQVAQLLQPLAPELSLTVPVMHMVQTLLVVMEHTTTCCWPAPHVAHAVHSLVLASK